MPVEGPSFIEDTPSIESCQVTNLWFLDDLYPKIFFDVKDYFIGYYLYSRNYQQVNFKIKLKYWAALFRGYNLRVTSPAAFVWQ